MPKYRFGVFGKTYRVSRPPRDPGTHP